jgi:hypothetical protein
MGKLVSGRVKRKAQTGITSDRYQFLGLDQAEPNLGDPTVGPSSTGANPVKVGSVYQVISIDQNPGERFWVPLAPGISTDPGVITVYQDGALPAGDNKFTQINGLNFVGLGVTIETPAVNGPTVGVGIATVRFNKGPQGLQGIQGDFGLQGIQGIQGLRGSQGLQGIQGFPGQGLQGIQGLRGSQGLQGIQGDFGLQGIQGLRGSQGLQGIQGDLGLQGIQGIQGLRGSQGLQGIQGDFGLQGIQGLRGSQGLQGIQGDLGLQGIQGLRGSQGLQGFQGIQGFEGSVGGIGPQGIQGTVGSQGIQGIPGQGLQGIQGLEGPQGITGAIPEAFTGTWNNVAFFRSHNVYYQNKLINSTDKDTILWVNASLVLTRIRENGTAVNYPLSGSVNTFPLNVNDIAGSYLKARVYPFDPYVVGLTTDPDTHPDTIQVAFTRDNGTANADRVELNAQFYVPVNHYYSIKVYGFKGYDADQWGVASSTNTLEATTALTYADVPPTTSSWSELRLRGDDPSGSYRGPQGIQGIQGTIGPGGIGPQGLQGIQGLSGSGSQGIQGIQGSFGLQGIQGGIGPQGIQGLAGIGSTGSQGIQGIQGSFGLQGIQGGIGPQGIQGLAGIGSTGSQGIQGIQGIQGRQGIQGLTGIGSTGTIGPQGIQGIQGSFGPQGIQGLTGIGSTGTIGPQGIQGLSGSGGSSITVINDEATNLSRYVLFNNNTSGITTELGVSASRFTFNPSTGNLSATEFTSLSDETKKINIRPIENSLDIVNRLEGVRFEWRDTNQTSVGVIAQQVEEILPEVVYTQDGGEKSVSYGNIIGVLIEAIKEQQLQINELKDCQNAKQV